jgi:hypothetical protein
MARSPDVDDHRASDARHVLVSLAEQRVSSFPRLGIGSQRAVESEFLARGADKHAEHRSQCEHELIFPRFRGHPNKRKNAPGVIHGQERSTEKEEQERAA